MESFEKRLFESAVRFTEAYRKFSNSSKTIREAMCLKEQYPATMQDILPGDVFAGRMGKAFTGYIVGFHTQGYGAGLLTDVLQQSAYCFNADQYARVREVLGSDYHNALEELCNFWKTECTGYKFQQRQTASEFMEPYRMQNAIYDELCMPKGAGFVTPGRRNEMRFSGFYPDHDKLIQNGLDGLSDMVEGYIKSGEASGRNVDFYIGIKIALEVVRDTILYYREQILQMADSENGSTALKGNYLKMAETLERIAHHKPETLREGIQLMWIYSLMTTSSCFGRMDEYLGDLYAADIDSGRLTGQEAEDLVYEIFRMIRDTINPSDGRVILGGYGRRNPENADRFAYAAISAQLRIFDLIPVLTLRIYKGMDTGLLKKALDVLGEGCLYPTLYNDDVYVDGIRRLLEIPLADAYQYAPLGCGEMCLMGMGHASPNSTLNAGKTVELVLNNGYDPVYKRNVSIKTGDVASFDTFDKLVEAVKAQLDYGIKMAAYAHKLETETEGEAASYLLPSLLFNDCLEKGLGIFDGGSRYNGGCIEGFGFTNLADSLYALKKLIYDDRIMDYDRVKTILAADFEGYEKEQKLMLGLPKYGNGEKEVDEILYEIKRYAAERAMYWGKKAGLDFFLVSNVNPGAIQRGFCTGATPDGRKCGEPFAIGNSPCAGRDNSGLAAMLNSVSGVDAANGGYITNLKLSREVFKRHRATLEQILDTFFKMGGEQLNITTVDKEDLERAVIEPEKYQNLIVRLGGWAAKFVELDSVTQREFMNRTQY